MERAQGGGRGGPGSTLPEGPGSEQDACCPALAAVFTRIRACPDGLLCREVAVCVRAFPA